MHRFGFLPAAVLAAAVATGSATAPAADNDYRLTGPYTRGNLSIYLIHRENTDRAPVPLALGEAMEQGAVEVLETGTVEELVIRNTGDRAVFIQAGDIVKGGKQDRVLTASMILPPHSGDIADARSRSSLQLSLENPDLASALEDYEAALGRLAQDHADAVGYVFAVGGKLDGGDEFDSAGLFRKLWARQLRAAATQALASDPGPGRDPPAPAEVSAFIDGARRGDAAVREMPGGMSLEAREAETALYTEMRRARGSWFHRAFIAR